MSSSSPSHDLYNAPVTAGAGIDQARKAVQAVDNLQAQLDAHRELLLTVGRWRQRLEGGAFESMKDELKPSERTDVDRQFGMQRDLIDKAAKRSTT